MDDKQLMEISCSGTLPIGKQTAYIENIDRIGNVERIEPDRPFSVKKKINPFIILTVSVTVFVLLFAFADVGFKIFNKSVEELPYALLSEFYGVRYDIESTTFSEYLSASVMGISEIKTAENASVTPDTETDELTEKEDLAVKNEPEETDRINDISTDTRVPDTTEATDTAETGDDRKYPITSMDLSSSNLGSYYIGNETGYNPDIKGLLERKDVIPDFIGSSSENDPLVLIIHTHGTEAYAEEGAEYYYDNGGEISRSKDPEKNVVAIGKLMAEILNSSGIKTLHSEIMHDEESYQDSYTRASETIKNYLAKYPTIKYVFDIHRDAILRSDGALVKAVTEIDGENVAQVMTVVGSNYKGADFPDWENHLSLALQLKSILDNNYPSLSRPVYLRGAAYNQQYTEGSLLLEIGTSGNTLEEAKTAAKYVALALVDLIKGE